MNQGRKSPVEPLSRPAWERVEAGVFARLERGEHLNVPKAVPTRRVPVQIWAGAVALAAAAAFLLWWRLELPNAPGGGADARKDEATPVAHMPAQPRREETAHIVTAGDSTRTTLGEATLTLAAASDVHVSGSDTDGWLIGLEAGQVDCEVAPRRGRPPFVVRAGETRVTVVGTRFTVTREGFGARVKVREGHVQISSGAIQLSLGPGEEWPEPPVVTTPSASPVDGSPIVGADKAAKHSKKVRRAHEVPQAAQQFEKAARLEAGDPRAALDIYRKLASGKSRWAANALYAQARLEFEMGRRKSAQVLLQRYLQRYPKGLNSTDVETLLKRIAASE
jgi:hypothetical protein